MIRSPGATTPCGRIEAPQLLDERGFPSSASAPTARTEGSAAGSSAQLHPPLPPAATTRTFFEAHRSTALRRLQSRLPSWRIWPPLTLITCAPQLTASWMASARRFGLQGRNPPSRLSGKTGMIKPRQEGAIPSTGPPGCPKMMLATWVPCTEAPPSGGKPSAARRGLRPRTRGGSDRRRRRGQLRGSVDCLSITSAAAADSSKQESRSLHVSMCPPGQCAGGCVSHGDGRPAKL